MNKPSTPLIILVCIVVFLSGCNPSLQSTVGTVKNTSTPTLRNTVAPVSHTVTPTARNTVAPASQTVTPFTIDGKPTLKLTFVVEQSGKFGVYGVDVGCLDQKEVCLSEPRLLFERPKRVDNLDWSPDGKRVAFSYSFSDIYVADWDGWNRHQITETCTTSDQPRWSPDGSQIALLYSFRSHDCQQGEWYQVYFYHVKSGEMEQKFQDTDIATLDWAGDEKFVFVGEVPLTEERAQNIHLIDMKTNEEKFIPFPTGVEHESMFWISFSPDGQKMVFSGETEDRSENAIFILDMRTNEVVQLTHMQEHTYSPAWSFTGDWIAYQSVKDGRVRVNLIKADGSGAIEIAPELGKSYSPAWRWNTTP